MGKNNSYNINSQYGKFTGDVYILGSGATMDYFNKWFFRDRVVIGLNNIYKSFRCDYVLSHHHEIVQEAIDAGQTVITSKHNICQSAFPAHNFNGEYYFYEHTEQGFCSVDMTKFGKVILAAGTPVVAAMQIAWKMGFGNIIFCGVDGGSIDGRLNYKDYPQPTQQGHPNRVQPVIERVAKEIRAKGVGVYSVNPFINLTLEGHKFT